MALKQNVFVDDTEAGALGESESVGELVALKHRLAEGDSVVLAESVARSVGEILALVVTESVCDTDADALEEAIDAVALIEGVAEGQ